VLRFFQEFQLEHPKQSFRVVVYGCIGDCPALKLLLNMIGHTGYFCCFYCHLKGVHNAEARKRQYPFQLPIDYRTTRSFQENGREAETKGQNVLGHLGASVLEHLVDISLPDCVLIDYTHVSLLRHFRDVVRTISRSLSPETRKSVDKLLRAQRFPHFFNRKMRGIEDFSHIKAIELKNLLLYGFIPHFLPHLSIDQLCFLALFIIGIRLLHVDQSFKPLTSTTADNLLSTYYREHHLFFRHHANFVLHLHQHYGRLYDQHGPLSSVNTFAQEDFMGYISSNKNGTKYFGNLMAHYYNIDVHLYHTFEERNSMNDGKFCALDLQYAVERIMRR
jgi:hypothetical protein